MSAFPYDAGKRLSSPTFAGRETELDLLCGALRALDTTGARTVLVGGEAGIGKTRLVDELRERARCAGVLVAAGVCSPAQGGGLPYAPIVGVLRDLSRQLDEPTATAVLTPARLGFGLLEPTGDVADPGAAANEMGKTRLFEALLTCFTALAEHFRVVLVVEDMQWADSASVEVIDFLARNLGDSPLLLIGTYRADEVREDQALRYMLAELGRHRAVSQIELAGLDRDATAAMMAGILGHRPEWSLIDAVHGRSEGNPFFAEELTAARGATSLPSSLRNVIMLRVERLSAAGRHVVAVAATAGTSIANALLASACDLESEALTAAITEAVELQVLTVDAGSRFRFRHGLQRDAVYGAMLPSERTRLHRRVAVALAAHPELAATGPGHAVVELAGHWWEAQDWSEALPASIAAGDAMTALIAIPEAYAHYEHAVTCCERVRDEDSCQAVDRIDLLLKTADAAYLTGAAQRSVELVDTVLAAIDTDSDPRRAAIAFTMLGRSAWAVGDANAAFDAFRRATEVLPADAPSVELAGVIAEEARGLMLVARNAESVTRCHEAIAVARAAGARAEEGHALCTLGCALAERGDHDEGLARMRESLAIAEELGHPDLLNRAYGNLTHVLIVAGRLDEAAAIVFDGMARGERLMGMRLNGAGQNSAEALIRLGRWREADELLASMDERGVGSCIFGPHSVRALLDTRRGNFEAAAERLVAADELSAGLRTVQVRGWFHILGAELALEEGRPAPAYEAIEYALIIAAGTDDSTYRPEMCALGIRALADQHDAARARGRAVDIDKLRRLTDALVEQADRCLAMFQESGRPCPPRLRAFLGLCEAEATRLRAPDPDAWQVAAAQWDDAGEPFYAAYCRWREADATLSRRGGQQRAADAARAAWKTAVELGARPLQARVERLALRARIRLANAEGDVSDSPRKRIAADLGLTPRETEVLAQLARGRTDRQIGEDLFISRKTASVHVSNILRKLDAANRVEAAEIGQRVGLE